MSTTTVQETAPDVQPAPVSARRSVSAHALFWFTVVLLLGVDLWSKAWVFANLGAREVRTMIPGMLEFRRSLNDGAVFGSFSGRVGVFIIASVFALLFVMYLFMHSHAKQRVLHVCLAMILAGALGNLYDRAFMIADVVQFSDGRMRLIGKVVGDDGGPTVQVGDWPDGGSPDTVLRSKVEIHQQGVVRDFLKFVPKFPKSFGRLGGVDMWPWVFNIADAALVMGVILLILTSIFERAPRHQTQT